MTYRDPAEALRDRTRTLEGELRDLEARKQDAAKLDAERTKLQDRLTKTRILAERAEQKRALPMLESIRIASPCDARWDEMAGDDKSRFCGKCEKNVYNLSAMSREEAELLMLDREGDLCVRLYKRKDGTVLTADCPVGVRRKRLRLVGVLAIGGGLAASAFGFGASRAFHTQTVMGDMRVEEPVVMGGMMPVPADAAAPVVPSAVPTSPDAESPSKFEPDQGHRMGRPAAIAPTKGSK